MLQQLLKPMQKHPGMFKDVTVMMTDDSSDSDSSSARVRDRGDGARALGTGRSRHLEDGADEVGSDRGSSGET